MVPLDQLGKPSAGVSPAASAFMLRLVSARNNDDREAINKAVELASQALEAGNPDGPMMAHALISMPLLKAA
ncbi:hypothetical protein D3C78_1711710 [compost metagenome]